MFSRKNQDRDEVEIASEESFPASDAPSHTPVTGVGHAHPDKEGMGGGMMKKAALLGAGVIAVAAGIWQFKRRR